MKTLARDHVVTIQYALALAALRLRKKAKTTSCEMTKQWRLEECKNILEALDAFKVVHGDERKTIDRRFKTEPGEINYSDQGGYEPRPAYFK